MYLAQNNAEIRLLCCAFMKQSLIVAWMNKELIRGGLKAVVLF